MLISYLVVAWESNKKFGNKNISTIGKKAAFEYSLKLNYMDLSEIYS